MKKGLHIDGVHSVVTKDIERYVQQKIGLLEKYVPMKARESFHIDVKLKEGKAQDKQKHTCEVIMYLPHATLTVHERALSMTAAIDMCEDKLKIQLKKYKDTHGEPHLHRRLINRFRRKA